MLLTWFHVTSRFVPFQSASFIAGWLLVWLVATPEIIVAADQSIWTRTVQSGPWSAASTWDGGKIPAAGARVHIRTGHAVTYDIKSDVPIRAVCVAGRLSFAADRDTQLNVGILKIEAGDEPTEEGFDCSMHFDEPSAKGERPALEVGTAQQPIAAGYTALIRLVAVEGQDKQSCPAIVCCAGRMDFHGAPLNRAWLKLGATSKIGEKSVTVEEAVTGWRLGDQIIITATKLGRD
ncbi:MAG: hypothetical protein JWM11_5872, partial [Planctomycetaceae bacterium]|nr:hypothetical protein [Planctomycetaceae bacterium]